MGKADEKYPDVVPMPVRVVQAGPGGNTPVTRRELNVLEEKLFKALERAEQREKEFAQYREDAEQRHKMVVSAFNERDTEAHELRSRFKRCMEQLQHLHTVVGRLVPGGTVTPETPEAHGFRTWDEWHQDLVQREKNLWKQMDMRNIKAPKGTPPEVLEWLKNWRDQSKLPRQNKAVVDYDPASMRYRVVLDAGKDHRGIRQTFKVEVPTDLMFMGPNPHARAAGSIGHVEDTRFLQTPWGAQPTPTILGSSRQQGKSIWDVEPAKGILRGKGISYDDVTTTASSLKMEEQRAHMEQMKHDMWRQQKEADLRAMEERGRRARQYAEEALRERASPEKVLDQFGMRKPEPEKAKPWMQDWLGFKKKK